MDELLTPAEAAKLLHVSKNTMYGLVRAGALHPVNQGLGSTRFRRQDVLELMRLREDRELDLPRVAAMARESSSLARQTAHQLDQLFTYLGFGLPRLATDRQSVCALYIRMGDLLDDLDQLYPPVGELVDWARQLYAVDEDYLDRVRDHTDDDQPWRRPLEVAHELVRRAPTGQFDADRELARACGYVEAARRSLRNVCYFWVRTRMGARKAELAFPNAREDVHERVLSLAFPE